MRNHFFFFCTAFLSLASLGAAETHPFSVEDMVALKRVGDPNVSPDGLKVVFVIRTADLEANKMRSNLWMVNSDGSGLHQLTFGSVSDYSPKWGPVSEAVYFLSSRSGSSQIWRIRADGGEAERITDLPLDVGNFLVSAGGKRLLLTLEVFPDCVTVACTADRLQEIKKRKASGVLFERLFIRHWDQWSDGRRSHLFSFDVGSEAEPIDLMPGMDADTPSQPFGGSEEITVSPDGSTAVFTARIAGTSEPWSTNFDLFSVSLDGSSRPVCLTQENRAWDTQPVFSPDGRRLAYLAMSRPGYESDRFKIMIRDRETGAVRVLADAWDRSPSSIVWSPDGRQLVAAAEDFGQQALFSIDTESGQVVTVVSKGTAASPQFAGGRIVFVSDNLKFPAEIFSVEPDGAELQALTSVNENLLVQIRMGDFEQFSFKGWNGERVYAFLVKPVDFEPNRKYPLAFLIHGGPQGSFGNHFHYRWNPQAYAGAGYAAVMIDFHGSTGYGQAFSDAIRDDWGGKPLEDLKKGLEATLLRYPWIDRERIGALGASYGGYMINWIAGNWPDRFRCLVNHDGVFDMRSMYYSTEELWFPEWEQLGPYWRNPDGHEKHNPAAFVERWKTPMLVIHSALDFRLPLEQGIAAFTALQRRGVPSKFLYFPDENHWVLKPANSIQWHETVLGWLDRYLKR